MSTPEMGYRGYSSEDLAIDWGVPVAAVRGWLASGLLERDPDTGRVTRPFLLRFVNSEDGQAALAEARAGS
jgi:hypothetical protein